MEIYTAATSGGTSTLVTTITNPANGTINYTFTPGQAYVRVYLRKLSNENISYYLDNLRIQTMASPYMAMIP